MLLRNAYTKALRDQRRGLAGWGVGITVLVLLQSAVWPTVRGMTEMRELLTTAPEALRKLFDLEIDLSGTGYLNAQLFAFMMPLLFMAYAIGHGAKAIAGEEQAGTLEVLLVTPVTPARLALQQAAALATAVAVLGAILFGAMMVFSPIFGLGVSAGAAASGALAMVLLGIEFGWLALAIGAATGHRGTAIGTSAILAVGAYALHALGALVESVQPWQIWSPIHQAIAAGPLGAGLPLNFAWMATGGALALLAALPVFHRRDITTPQ